MKVSLISVSLLATTVLSSPIADPNAKAIAAPHFKSWLSRWLNGGFNNNNNNNNNNSNSNNNNNQNQVINEIYIIPGGSLISGNATTVPAAAVPFQGTVQNNTLYANSPSLGNVGTVTVAQDGKLKVVPNESPAASQNTWEMKNGTLSPNGANIVCCPDVRGRPYLYAGVTCPGASPISILATN